MIKLVKSFFYLLFFLLFVIGATAAETEKIVIDELVFFLPLAEMSDLFSRNVSFSNFLCFLC